MTQVMMEIGVLFVIILFGFYLGKKAIIDDQMATKLSALVLSGTFPALIITSMDRPFDALLLDNSIKLVGLTLLFTLCIILSIEGEVRLRKKFPDTMSARHFMTLFGNTSFMGMPILNALYGAEGVFYVAVINIIFNALMFSYGLFLFSRKERVNWGQLLMNPGFISTWLGVILFLSPLSLPYLISRPLNWCGSMTIPLALLIAGSIISRHPFKSLVRPFAVWRTSLIRIVLFPFLLLTVLSLARVDNFLVTILVIVFSTPAPLTATAFSEKYGGDVFFTSKVVALSNLLFLGTMPTLLFILNLIK